MPRGAASAHAANNALFLFCCCCCRTSDVLLVKAISVTQATMALFGLSLPVSHLDDYTRQTSVPFFQVAVTAPVVSTSKNCSIYGFIGVRSGISNLFWIQVAVSFLCTPHGVCQSVARYQD
jgi:hypothetical protein